MQKRIYTDKQMLEIATFINGLTVTGIEVCKMVSRVADIIDNPIETIEEEEGEKE